METIQFTCGNCDKAISVLREHLGTRVQCPYCGSVVEAVDPGDEPLFSASPEEAESIFGADDDNDSDDLFGGPRSDQIEMPTDPKIAARSPALAEQAPEADAGDDFLSSKEPEEEAEQYDPQHEEIEDAGGPTFEGAPGDFHQDADEPVEHAPSALVERHRKPSMLTPLLLIFLIPYSIVMTIAVIYLYTKVRARGNDHMEKLRDPSPNDGGPRRSNLYPYNTELTASLKTQMNRAIQIGDVEVTPMKIVHNDGTLELYLKIRNMSDSVRFNALPNSFLEYNLSRHKRPYSFLQSEAYEIFIDDVRWGNTAQFDRILGPGQADIAVLRTQVSMAKQKLVRRLLRIQDREFLWRVQVRRGFVDVGGEEVSATCVIGVQFSTGDVQS